MDKEEVLYKLKTAINSNSADLAEKAVAEVHTFGYESEFAPYLIELLETKWHFRHEDIVLALQATKDNRATKTLLKTAKIKFEYLDYDNSYSLSRKCTWALADIGTDESKKALEELSQWHDKEIAEYAQKRLNNWEAEKNRKTAANKTYKQAGESAYPKSSAFKKLWSWLIAR